jgi:hypothetical protein
MAFTLPKDIPLDLIKERVTHALETNRGIGQQTDYTENPIINITDDWIDRCREQSLDPTTAKGYLWGNDPFQTMDSDWG